MLFLGAACVDLSLSLLRIASVLQLHVQQCNPNMSNFLPIICNLLPYDWQKLCYLFGQHLQHGCMQHCQAMVFYNALVAIGNIRYILPECINEQNIQNVFVVYLQRRLIQLSVDLKSKFAIYCAIQFKVHSYFDNEKNCSNVFGRGEN